MPQAKPQLKSAPAQGLWGPAWQVGLLAFGVTALFALLCQAVFGMRYLVNDDAIISNLAAGAYGGDTQYLVYVNVLFGFFLKPFYALAPGLNWFVALLFSGGVACFSVLGGLLIQRWGPARGLLLHFVLLLLAGQDFFARFHYVKYAALFCAVGAVLLALNLGRINAAGIWGAALLFLGSLLRFQQFMASGGMAAALLLWHFFRLQKPARRKALILAGAMLLACLAAKGVDLLAYRANDGWAAYTQYNAARTQISDMRIHFATDPTVLQPLGYSENDFAVISRWMYYDPDVFTPQALEAIAEALPGNTLPAALRAAAGAAVRALFTQPVHLLFSLVLLAWLLLSGRGRRLAFWGTLGLLAAQIFYLSWLGRYPARVDESLILTALVYCAACFDSHGAEAEKKQGVLGTRAMALAAAGLLVAMAPTLLAARTQAQAYRASHLPRAADIDALAYNKGALYLLDSDFVDAANGYDVWHARPRDYFSNIVFVGSWLMEAPPQTETLARYGLRNPWQDTIGREDVVVVDLYHQDIRVAYLNQHYDPTAWMLEVGEGESYKLYRYVSGSI